MTRDAMLLVDALRDPKTTRVLSAKGWAELISMACTERLIGTLAYRLADAEIPLKVAEILAEARLDAEYQCCSALWEADCARRTFADYPGKVTLLKGTAYVAAGLNAGKGRSIGDLDIMVARKDLPQVEAALLKAGWEWVKPDPYDDAYYRNYMHELPPLIHKERDRMIDVHHTILPLTARRTPDAEAMLRDATELSVPEGKGLFILSPPDMVCHSAAHLFADGDLSGGLRNLWDIHCLLTEFAGDDPDFWNTLDRAAKRHQLTEPVRRAARLAHSFYGTDIPQQWQGAYWDDRWYRLRMTARDGWGRPTRKFIRLVFLMRSHGLRMPPLMLARHLWVKWRKGQRNVRSVSTSSS
ncbi:MAG: nucleotidyltransferase domain-containing protein [Sphingorhabdus sp.]